MTPSLEEWLAFRSFVLVTIYARSSLERTSNAAVKRKISMNWDEDKCRTSAPLSLKCGIETTRYCIEHLTKLNNLSKRSPLQTFIYGHLIIRENQEENFFGCVQCHIEFLGNLLANFIKFYLIFKNTSFSQSDKYDWMEKHAEAEGKILKL